MLPKVTTWSQSQFNVILKKSSDFLEIVFASCYPQTHINGTWPRRYAPFPVNLARTGTGGCRKRSELPKKVVACVPKLHTAIVANRRQPKIYQANRQPNGGHDRNIGRFSPAQCALRTVARRIVPREAGSSLGSSSSRTEARRKQ